MERHTSPLADSRLKHATPTEYRRGNCHVHYLQLVGEYKFNNDPFDRGPFVHPLPNFCTVLYGVTALDDNLMFKKYVIDLCD